MKFNSWLGALALTLSSSFAMPAAAQEITLWDLPGFQGQRLNIGRSVEDLNIYGFNDRASSIEILAGDWEVCEGQSFGGQCMILSVSESSLARLDNRITSIRPVVPGLAGPRPGYDQGPDRGVWLYAGRNFGGQRIEVSNDISHLGRRRFNDRTASLVVARGERWEICEHTEYRGRCEIVEGETDLTRLNFHNTISSIREVDRRRGGRGRGRNRYSIDGGFQGTQSTFFPRPEINGYGIDRCMGAEQRNCDETTADRVCRAAGHREAAYFSIDRRHRARTWWMGSNRQCNRGRCEPIVDLLCVD
jgi:hypothetical protein